MDATAPELGVNCRATTNQVWRENASGDITHFPFFAFQTQRKGSSRMWARVYKRLILRRPCTHPKTTLRSICKSKKKKLYLLWFKRNRNQTEFKLHSLYYWKGKFGLSRRYHMDRHSSSLEEFAPVSLTSSPASHSACDSGAIQTGEIRIEFPGGIIAHFSGMAESQAAMQLLTQLCNRHVLPEWHDALLSLSG